MDAVYQYHVRDAALMDGPTSPSSPPSSFVGSVRFDASASGSSSLARFLSVLAGDRLLLRLLLLLLLLLLLRLRLRLTALRDLEGRGERDLERRRMGLRSGLEE
jgi:hypothetical protein